MDIIRIGNETHKIAGTPTKTVGDPLSGRWTVYRQTEDPDIVYAVEYRDGQEYEERFERRAVV